MQTKNLAISTYPTYKEILMKKSLNRRGFLNILLMGASATALLAQNQQTLLLVAKPTSINPQGLTKINRIDNQFISVNGWVLPVKALITGGT